MNNLLFRNLRAQTQRTEQLIKEAAAHGREGLVDYHTKHLEQLRQEMKDARVA